MSPIPGSSETEADLSPADLRQAILKKARTSRKISWLLDECIRIPGTDIRFGLDPILGLLPYGGETVTALIGTVILGEAGKKGIPFKTLIRMGGNMILNAGIGAIPLLGDLFSFWFKSNTRNYRMLNTYLENEEGDEESGGWWPILLIVAILGIVFALNILAWFLLFGIFWKGLELFSA